MNQGGDEGPDGGKKHPHLQVTLILSVNTNCCV